MSLIPLTFYLPTYFLLPYFFRLFFHNSLSFCFYSFTFSSSFVILFCFNRLYICTLFFHFCPSYLVSAPFSIIHYHPLNLPLLSFTLSLSTCCLHLLSIVTFSSSFLLSFLIVLYLPTSIKFSFSHLLPTYQPFILCSSSPPFISLFSHLFPSYLLQSFSHHLFSSYLFTFSRFFVLSSQEISS